jgi:hypothetical protein
VTEVQEGEKLRVKVTSTDSDGSGTTATSKPTAIVTDPPPTLTPAKSKLTITAGGAVAMGVSVAGFDADDTMSVTINGLTSDEFVTDGADSTVFSGSSVTLTATEVNAGLTLHSTFSGTGHPKNTLTLTASDTTSGETVISPAQKIVVTDPPVTTMANVALLRQSMACIAKLIITW